MDQEIVPFLIDVPEAELANLRERLRQTRWPEPELVPDWSQGVPLAYLRDLCGYWADGYDWRATEARLNALPQFQTVIDGLNIVFVHARSPRRDALPLIMTHGWPGSIIEFGKAIGPLSDPGRDGTMPSTSCARRCPVTGSAENRTRPAGGSSGSPGRGPS